ncbi:hypothetical protein SMALA_3000 [Streptomyces malaysiensis subsp. malaysiensis]|nr:hypothetical protein SMALA_3000 [Streptomyces malaysiensis]
MVGWRVRVVGLGGWGGVPGGFSAPRPFPNLGLRPRPRARGWSPRMPLGGLARQGGGSWWLGWRVGWLFRLAAPFDPRGFASGARGLGKARSGASCRSFLWRLRVVPGSGAEPRFREGAGRGAARRRRLVLRNPLSKNFMNRSQTLLANPGEPG